MLNRRKFIQLSIFSSIGLFILPSFSGETNLKIIKFSNPNKYMYEGIYKNNDDGLYEHYRFYPDYEEKKIYISFCIDRYFIRKNNKFVFKQVDKTYYMCYDKRYNVDSLNKENGLVSIELSNLVDLNNK